jgi:hypothetical protein
MHAFVHGRTDDILAVGARHPLDAPAGPSKRKPARRRLPRKFETMSREKGDRAASTKCGFPAVGLGRQASRRKWAGPLREYPRKHSAVFGIVLVEKFVPAGRNPGVVTEWAAVPRCRTNARGTLAKSFGPNRFGAAAGLSVRNGEADRW